MLNALTGFGSKWTNPSAASISGLPAARKLQEEVSTHEKRGDLDKAKGCFETEIRKAEDLLQSNLNESELKKTREFLAASYLYYGNFLRQCGDKFNADAKYTKALEHAPHMDKRQPGVIDLYKQIGARYASFQSKDGNVSQGSSNQLDPTKELVANARPSKLGLTPPQRQVDVFIEEKSKRMDYLFGKALSTLGALKVANKPSLFLVYAHDNPAHGKAEASTSKYLIEKLSQIQVILYSDQTPMGQPYSSVSRDLKKDGKLEDILTNQLCLLPGRLRGDVAPVDKVTVCCSEVLGSYLKWSDYGHFYQKLREAYRKDREAYLKDSEQDSAVAIREVVREFSQEESYKAGFHHVLTEMAFLQIRAEELKDKHGIIPVALTRNSYDECLSDFVSATAVRMEDIPRFEEQAQAGREVYANQSRHGVLFKLIERLLAGSDEAQMFLNKFWQGYSDCVSHLKNDSKLDGLEFTQLVDSIFEDMRMAWYSQLAPTMQQMGTKLSDQSRDLVQIQTGVDSLVKKLLGNLQENIQKLKLNYLEGLEKDREIKDALANYVPLEGMQLYDSTRFNLEKKVRDFLNSDKKVLLLLGEAGSGKSTFNRQLAVNLWQEYIQTNSVRDSPIPVFIQLSSLPESNRNLVGAFFEMQGFSKKQIRELQTKHRFILILDGFDEIKERQRTFYQDNQLDDWKEAKIIISSRPEYLGSNYQYKFHPSGERGALQEYRLAPFSEETIERYVDQYKEAHPEGPWSGEQYKEALKQPDLKELVGNPFLLKIALSVLPELSKILQAKGQRFTRIALYEHFLNNWFNRSQKRLAQIQLSEREAEEFKRLELRGFIERGVGFNKKLAIEMYRAGEVATTYSSAADDPWEEPGAELSQDWRKRFFGDDNAMTVLVRLNAPLICRDKQDGSGKEYRFIHKSVRDYLVARTLWEALDEHNKIKSSSWLNTLNIVNDPAVLQFLAERVRQELELANNLLGVVEQSKGEKGAQFERGAANAITALVRAGVQFNEADLKGIRISRADLSGGVFDSAQLQGADLREVNLRQVWLREANLSSAHMAGVQFGEWPYLEEEDSVRSCAYSPDGKTCAVGLGNGKISLYWTSNWEKMHTLEGHTKDVLSVAYSPSGTQLASVSKDCTVRLWDMQRGVLVHILEGHTEEVNSVVYSPSGEQLASGSRDYTVRLWDTQRGALVHTLEGHTDLVTSVVCSPNGEQLASGSRDYTVRLWDTQRGALVHTLEGHTDLVTSVVCSPNGEQLASGSWDCTVRLWDVQRGVLVHTLEGHTDLVTSVVYSPDGEQLASGSWDCTVRLWDVQRGVLFHTLEGHTDLVTSVVYSPNGEQLASGSWDHTVRLWEAKSGTLVHILEGHIQGINSVLYSPSGEQLASGSADHTVRFWKRGNGVLVHTLEGHTKEVNSVVYSPSGEQLASGSDDKTVRLWDAKSGALVHTLEGHTDSISGVVYSPSGGQLASGSWDDTVRLWEADSGALVHILEGHTNTVNSVVYSPSGEQLASGSVDYTVRLWEAESGALVHTLEGHTDSISGVVYSPSGGQLASGSADKTVRLWDAKSGALIHILEGHTDSVHSVVYSPSGEQLASGDRDDTVRLWEAESGALVHTLEGHTGSVSSVVYSPSGEQLASGSWDHTVRLWEAKSGNLVHILEGHTGAVFGVTYSQSGEQLASVSWDRTVRLWEVASGTCLRVIEGFRLGLTSVAWKERPEGSYLLTGSRDGVVCQWAVKNEIGRCKVKLDWTSWHRELNVGGTRLEGIVGLSEMNKKLLEQRGRPPAYDGYESDAASSTITSEEEYSTHELF